MDKHKVIYINEQICIVDKPSGYLSVPGRFKDNRPILGLELEAELASKIYPVHRLDYEVSGIMIYARTKEAHRQLNLAFEKQQVKKCYQALSQGGQFSEGDHGEWRCHLLRGKKRTYEKPWGDLAITQFKLIKQWPQLFYEWRLFPQTGRSHQLRYELFRHGSPILGDQLYGSSVPWLSEASESIALRALELRFEDSLLETLNIPSSACLVSPLEFNLSV